METTTSPTVQVLARLVWASSLASWANVQAPMKPAVAGLVRRGLMERRERDNALLLTPAGAEMLEAAGIPLNAAKESAVGAADKLVPGAKFWTDAWGQQVPA